MTGEELLDKISDYYADRCTDIHETLHGDFVSREDKIYEQGVLDGLFQIMNRLAEILEEE